MNRIVTCCLVSVFALLLSAGCADKNKTDDSVGGMSAKEWRSLAESCKQRLDALMPIREKEVSAEEAAKREAQAKLDNEYLSKGREASRTLGGQAIIAAGRTVVLGLKMSDSDDVIFGEIAPAVSRDLQDAIVSSQSKSDPDLFATAEPVGAVRATLKLAALEWLVADPSRLTIVWQPIRPALRQKYTLLKTVRVHAALFKTPYSSQAFAAVTECLEWHVHAQTNSDRTPSLSEREIKSCNAEFKTFGIDASVNDSGSVDLTRNALWIVRFLARRSADGGDAFARKFQELALDYSKS